MVLSSLCVAHCILTPILLIALPLMGAFLRNELFHQIMLVILVPTAAYAFITGVRQHRNRWVVALGALGVILIALGAFEPETSVWGASTILTILGSASLVTAHLINRQLCQQICQKPANQCCYHES
jgi:Na+/citrate or Na+/malate symporter